MKNNFFFLPFFHLHLFFFSYKFLESKQSLSFADEFSINPCNSLSFEKSKNIHPSEFQSFDIKLQIDEKRKWASLNLRDAIKAEKINSFTNRERVKGRIIVILEMTLNALLKSHERAHGDQVRQGKGLPSLNIKITDGHIFGIVDLLY